MDNDMATATMTTAYESRSVSDNTEGNGGGGTSSNPQFNGKPSVSPITGDVSREMIGDKRKGEIFGDSAEEVTIGGQTAGEELRRRNRCALQ
jgi:hypothetical protein